MEENRKKLYHRLWQRMASGLMALCMAAALLPAEVLAAGGTADTAADFTVMNEETVSVEDTAGESKETESAAEEIYTQEAALPTTYDSYLTPYLDKMVDWGFMRGDAAGNLNENKNITRAEFVSIINRAFGYKDTSGTHPFSDVTTFDWFGEDVTIAYNTGYINGTTESTFSPYAEITREAATVILARNMRMEPVPGENIDFSDSRQLGTWSSGLVAAAVDHGLISGYADGTFQPQKSITRGEVAVLVSRAIGTPIQTAGVHTLGEVYGNVVIGTSGVTLRDTTIVGNLYVTAGVELGDVLMENVSVLGEIIISGGGISEDGDESVVMRNVDAYNLTLDQLGQEVSIRVEGTGVIQETTIRSDAYLKDNTLSSFGLQKITLDSEEPSKMTLSGNIKEVINKTPGSYIGVAQGQVESISVHEEAANSQVDIATGSSVGDLSLDTGTTVTGKGDIEELTVNTNGSTVNQLPEQIIIRPGVSGTIAGEQMDSTTAAEASATPRLLTGYPKIQDLAPTTASVTFAANKRGVIHWAVTAVADGSVPVEDLITPPAYTTKIIAAGTVSTTASATEVKAFLKNLKSGGSYYVSCVMEDARGDRSALKVISFTTPDNTVPNFAEGYPYLSKIGSNYAQAVVMATKTCRLYYAVLPKGATEPTGDDFKANAISGNLGFGSYDVTKNVELTIDRVNSTLLEEMEDYVVYFWLTDIQGGQSSKVVKLDFSTVDGTPPKFNTEATVNKVQETSVGLYANLNEAGTLYWVVVNVGTEYPKPIAGQSGEVDLASDTAKIQVKNGMNALKSGKVTMTQDKDVTFNIAGLEKEKSYDLYYVAQDKAGNYSETVKKITIHTLDNSKPTVEQRFTKYNGTDTTAPLANTDIELVFSEQIEDAATNTLIKDLYDAVASGGDSAREKLANVLRNSIKMYVKAGSDQLVVDGGTLPAGTTKNDGNWTIDYRYATVRNGDNGETIITFPTNENVIAESALNLKSGATYYFEIEANTIADTSDNKNVMGRTTLPDFTTVFAQVNLSEGKSGVITVENNAAPPATKDVTSHTVWEMRPISTEKAGDDMYWDMLIWSDTTITFNVYAKKESETTWKQLNTKGDVRITTTQATTDYEGVSLTTAVINKNPTYPEFDLLKTLDSDEVYQYAIEFTSINGIPSDKDDMWNGRVQIKINVVAGSTTDLRLMANDVTAEGWEENVTNGGVTNIGPTKDFILKIPFIDQSIPDFAEGYPLINEGATSAELSLGLTGKGRIFYVIAPAGDIPTKGKQTENGPEISYGDSADEQNGWKNWNTLPDGDGVLATTETPPYSISQPLTDYILNPGSWYQNNPDVKYGNVAFSATVPRIPVTGLIPETKYIAYFVLQNTAQGYSGVLCYRFETTAVGTPYLTLTPGDGTVSIKTSEDSNMSYIIVPSFDVTRTSPLNEKFAQSPYMSATNISKFTAKYDPDMTIFEAMTTTVTTQGAAANEGPSVFDEYAERSIKETIGRLIRQDQSSVMIEIVAKGANIAMTAGSVNTPSIREYLEEGVLYACLAVAYNKDGNLDGFKAVDNIAIKDRMPPIMTVSNVGVKEGATKGVWSGELILTFNENLYWLSNADQKTLKAVVGNQKYSSTIGILDCITAPAGTSVVGGGSTPTTSFRLKYTDISIGEQILLFVNGRVADASSNPREQIILTFSGDVGLINNPNNTPGFVITQGKIDGDKDANDD